MDTAGDLHRRVLAGTPAHSWPELMRAQVNQGPGNLAEQIR